MSNNSTISSGRKFDSRDRTKNAYMLVYERVAYFHMPSVKQMTEELRLMKVRESKV